MREQELPTERPSRRALGAPQDEGGWLCDPHRARAGFQDRSVLAFVLEGDFELGSIRFDLSVVHL